MKADRIADNLVLVMPKGMSLADWKRVGLLDREWRLYDRVGSSFAKICVVFSGPSTDPDLDAMLHAQAAGSYELALLSRPDGESPEAFHAAAAGRVAAALAPETGAGTIIKTEQLTAGPLAVELRDSLRTQGRRAALITRGGYLWSRFAALEHGPNSEAARTAAEAERSLCRAADLLVGTTDDMISDLCWRYRVELGRTAVIPNFVVPPAEVRASGEREQGLIVTAGALVARKRIGILIEAVARLDDELRAKVVLEVIGDGPEQGALREMAERLNAPVRFMPPLAYQALLERLGRCLVYAQASELEGHPKAVIDAMAAGAVAVVADSPGLGSLIRTGSTGVLVPTADPADFANAFTGLLSDTDWCDLLGGTAARHAASAFGLDLIVPRELEAYRRAIAAAAPARIAA